MVSGLQAGFLWQPCNIPKPLMLQFFSRSIILVSAAIQDTAFASTPRDYMKHLGLELK